MRNIEERGRGSSSVREQRGQAGVACAAREDRARIRLARLHGGASWVNLRNWSVTTQLVSPSARLRFPLWRKLGGC